MVKVESDGDGWIRGSSESIYAVKSAQELQSTPPPVKTARKSHATPSRSDGTAGTKLESRSLLDRMDITPPSASAAEQRYVASQLAASIQQTPSGTKAPSSFPLSSPARDAMASPNATRTPLSASHPVPETPLKLSQRRGPQTPATPQYPHYPNTSRGQHDDDASAASGLGLGLTPLKKSVPLTPSSDNDRGVSSEPLYMPGRAGSNASPTSRSTGSPLKSSLTDLQTRSSNTTKSAANESDRSRSAKSSLGTGASMWAPKPVSTNDTSADSPTSLDGMSQSAGAGSSSSTAREPHSAPERKRPTHRPSGLQLSLGQEIRVMQDVDEGTEDDLPSSSKSSAPMGGAFKIEPAVTSAKDQENWYGNVVPPTPALGCDSPTSSEDGHARLNGNGPSKGWGPARSNSLFSHLPPSSSRPEANWSGDDDDDDEHSDDDQVFQDHTATASNKSRSVTNASLFTPLPPPPLQYKSRTPSPTHRLLAVSPRLDTDNRPHRPASPSGSAMGMAMQDAVSSRGSPASVRSALLSDNEDGDADVETDKPRRFRKPKKQTAAPSTSAKDIEGRAGAESVQIAHTSEQKKSLKRDKSERIRGRRQSQSREDRDSAVTSLLRATEDGVDLVDQVADISLEGSAQSGADQVESTAEPAQLPSSQPEKEDLPSGTPVAPSVQDTAVLTTPQLSTSAFDWAADDDDMDDALPDLDDWGVTISPVKASDPAPTPPAMGARKAGGKQDNDTTAWRSVGQGRQASKKDAAAKSKSSHHGGTDPDKGGKSNAHKAEQTGGLGARIAGRAAVPSAGAGHVAPPASTPYGSWNKSPAPASAASPPSATSPSTDKGTWKARKPPTSPKQSRDLFAPISSSNSSSSKPAPSSRGKPEAKDKAQQQQQQGTGGSTGRPRIAADLGALVKLISPSVEAAGKKSVVQADAKKEGKKDQQQRKTAAAAAAASVSKATGGSAADSMHAPSVGDSMHAPSPTTKPTTKRRTKQSH